MRALGKHSRDEFEQFEDPGDAEYSHGLLPAKKTKIYIKFLNLKFKNVMLRSIRMICCPTV